MRILAAAAVVAGLASSVLHVKAQTSESSRIEPALNLQTSNSSASTFADRLKAAYPGIIGEVKNNVVRFTDGSTLPFDDNKGPKPLGAWLDRPDIADMDEQPYPWEHPITPPGENSDPGRARNAAFFRKVYGDCTKGEVRKNLVSIPWMPKSTKQTIRVSSLNNVADAFQAVSRDLDTLPQAQKKYVTSLAGTYNCRTIAGTRRLSAHAYGIAIDIAPAHSDYWRWNSKANTAAPEYKNKIPVEIILIFERHGFIWGGRWSHFDTMHFEYRPELRR